MRILLLLPACLVLCGCPAGKPPAAPSPEPAHAESPTNAPAALSAAPTDSYEGVWTTTDDQGQEFDIVLFPNGQAVSNWTKGVEGAKGERGYWRQEENRLLIVYDDGWTDLVSPAGEGFQHRAFAPGVSITAAPTNQAAARRADPSGSDFIGVWRLNKEPDGSYLYLSLQSNGRAFSTINGGTEGKWEKTAKGALCTWPDGWVDLIMRVPEGWQKRSWVGSETNAPADNSEATRVGEARFFITP